MHKKFYMGMMLTAVLFMSGCNANNTSEAASVITQAESAVETASETVKETDAVEESSEQAKPVPSEEVVLYITRHGKTMLNSMDRFQGWIDSPLTPEGIDVAEALGRGYKIEGIEFDRVYTSDSGRAVETAQIILDTKAQNLQIQQDKRLREFNYGSFEGLTGGEMWSRIAEAQNITVDELMRHKDEVGFIQFLREFADTLAELDKGKSETGDFWPAEDISTIQKRLEEVYDDIVNQSIENGDSNVLIVSHSFSICTFVGMLDEAAAIPTTGLQNASVCKVVFKDGVYRLESVNDGSYVEKGAQ